MMNVLGVIPVGVVGENFGSGLLAVGELWFLLDVSYGIGLGRRWWLLFDGVSVVRCCWWQHDDSSCVGAIHGSSVEELEAFRVAVERFLEDVGSVV